MPLKIMSDQDSMTVQEFYADLAKGKYHSYDMDRGNMMLQLIEVINHLFLQTTIWCLTSHDRLCLIADDDWESERFVIIEPSYYNKKYHFIYFMPKENRPWDEASVHGIASSLEEAKKYLLIAMRESGGWSTNEELKKLLKEKLDS